MRGQQPGGTPSPKARAARVSCRKPQKLAARAEGAQQFAPPFDREEATNLRSSWWQAGIVPPPRPISHDGQRGHMRLCDLVTFACAFAGPPVAGACLAPWAGYTGPNSFR